MADSKQLTIDEAIAYEEGYHAGYAKAMDEIRSIVADMHEGCSYASVMYRVEEACS